MIRENVARVRERMGEALRRSGRPPNTVRLIAVTKTVPPEKIAEALSAGVREIGENRVQEAQSKFQKVNGAGEPPLWHLIGQLQSNKVNRAVEVFDWIESLDSLKLAQWIDRRAEALKKVQDCLVQVKISEEQTKTGLLEPDLPRFLEGVQGLRNLRLRGLMAIPPYFEDPGEARPYFRKARRIFEKCFGAIPGAVLSMGMSQDFEVAIEEGSTLVRIGQAIFGERESA